jgi:hypothetical protein
MKFLVPNYSCLQNPCLAGYRNQIPVLSVLCPQLNLLNPHTKFLGTPLVISTPSGAFWSWYMSTDGKTDGRTDGRTDKAVSRDTMQDTKIK